jgi:hypothetical protein
MPSASDTQGNPKINFGEAMRGCENCKFEEQQSGGVITECLDHKNIDWKYELQKYLKKKEQSK